MLSHACFVKRSYFNLTNLGVPPLRLWVAGAECAGVDELRRRDSAHCRPLRSPRTSGVTAREQPREAVRPGAGAALGRSLRRGADCHPREQQHHHHLPAAVRVGSLLALRPALDVHGCGSRGYRGGSRLAPLSRRHGRRARSGGGYQPSGARAASSCALPLLEAADGGSGEQRGARTSATAPPSRAREARPGRHCSPGQQHGRGSCGQRPAQPERLHPTRPGQLRGGVSPGGGVHRDRSWCVSLGSRDGKCRGVAPDRRACLRAELHGAHRCGHRAREGGGRGRLRGGKLGGGPLGGRVCGRIRGRVGGRRGWGGGGGERVAAARLD
ncbi:hypothetical protein T484DRAFT_3155613 [Baffinella frigidus]|nr:hypothetical protein T484DRAFT_3155613 [Cryptophyta sp. CCMP2293]